MNPVAIEDRRDGSARRISAGAMSLAVAVDPQFRLPARPRLADGLVIVPLADGLLVEGAAERQVLRGRAATTLLPGLLALLDGSRTVAEAAAELDVAPRAAGEACALLYACGLLDEGADAPATGELATFVRRHVDTTRVNRSAEEALARIAATRVAVVAAPGVPVPAAELERSGFGVVDVADADLVVALGLGGAELAALDDACAARGIPWLRSAAHARTIELGPYFDRRHMACYRCFAATHGAEPAGPAPTRSALWAGLLATELVHLAGRICQAPTTRGLVRLDGDDARIAIVPRTPGCPHCAPPPVPLDPRPPLALAHAYEQAVALPPRELLSPKDHQHHYKPANLALQHESKRHPGARHWPLPADRAPGGAFLGAAPAAGALDAATLSGLLRRAGGLRQDARPIPGKVQRWAPTGGNLGSVQLHVLLPAGLGELPPGAYFYAAPEHALAAVRPELDIDPDEALIVLSAAYARVRRKYGDFALRVVHLDPAPPRRSCARWPAATACGRAR